MGERVSCSVLLAIMCFVLGMSAAAHNLSDGQMHHMIAAGLQHASVIGGILFCVLLLQLLHLRRWKLWAPVMALLGLALGGSLLQLLTHKS
jgi:hypothetical protein